MNIEPIKAIMKQELRSDLIYLRDCISHNSYAKLFEFAHKYKLRLHYLQEQEALDMVTKVIDAFHNNQHEKQLELSQYLYDNLETLQYH